MDEGKVEGRDGMSGRSEGRDRRDRIKQLPFTPAKSTESGQPSSLKEP